MTPWFILVGGINGSGKSTFAQSKHALAALLDAMPEDMKVINPDLVTRQLQERDGLTLQDANLAAAQFCERQVDGLIRGGVRSFAIETVLSTEKYVARVQRAQRQGFRVLFVHMLLGSVEESIARVAQRVRKGGHDVPSDKIRERWSRTHANLPRFWNAADRSLVFFNGNAVKHPVLVAERTAGRVSFNESPPKASMQFMQSLTPDWMRA